MQGEFLSDKQLIGRDNNCNLVRFLAASAVLVGHAMLLTSAPGTQDLASYPGAKVGMIAVNIFFILSGFLITRSVLNKGSLIDYFVSRGARIFPGLAAMALFLTYVIGPAVSNTALVQYLFDWHTVQFLASTSILITDDLTLHGVFEHNPIADMYNVPLWTIKYEVLAYVGLAGLWLLGVLDSGRRYALVMCAFLTSYLVITFGSNLRYLGSEQYLAAIDNIVRFALCFLVGSTAYQIRDKLVLSGRMVLVVSVLAVPVLGSPMEELTLAFVLAYGLLWFAFVPAGAIRGFNKMGDYSYGIYIYHWPLGQAMLAVFPGVDLWAFLLINSILTLCAAVISWHAIERPALNKGVSISIALRSHSLAVNPAYLRLLR